MSELPTASQILQVLLDRGPLSRSGIARELGISISAVSIATKEMMTKGLIEETGSVRRGMGRPPIPLALRSDAAFFIGACINRDGLAVVLSNLSGQMLSQQSASLHSFDPHEVVSAVATMVNEVVESSRVPREDVAGAGLAVSGLVDSESGLCRHSTVLGWQNVEIRSMLEEVLWLPVELSNDANAVTIGERFFGGSAATDDLVVVSVGHGIGAGLFLRGRLYSGEHGVAGELGHCTVEPDGPACRCGKEGCLEAIASMPAMLMAATEANLKVSSIEDLEELAAKAPEARQILERAGAALGLAISYLVNILSPSLVIVTGSGAQLGPILQQAMRESLERHLVPLRPRPPQLQIHHEDEGVWARGAARLAAQAFIRRGGEFPSHPPKPMRLSAHADSLR